MRRDRPAQSHLACSDGMRVLLVNAYPEVGSYVPLFQELAERDRFGIHTVTDEPHNADIILFVDARSDHGDWRLNAIRQHPLLRTYPERAFIYNEMDQPWCALPGLYTSMPARSFDPRRQRACCYVARINPYVEADPADSHRADLLFSFVGRRCHPVREQILRLRHPGAFLRDTSMHNFFAPPTAEVDAQKRAYAEIMRRSKFILCPRGAGPASFRLFEAMAMQRVPVVISDAWVRPLGPRWEEFTISVRERDVERVPEIVAACEDRFEAMAAAARRAWEEWFAPNVLFHRMIEDCRAIMEEGQSGNGMRQRGPDRRYAALYLRSIARGARDRVRRWKR